MGQVWGETSEPASVTPCGGSPDAQHPPFSRDPTNGREARDRTWESFTTRPVIQCNRALPNVQLRSREPHRASLSGMRARV